MRASEKAWTALGVGVVAYEILCPKGETLSEGLDPIIEKHPILTRIAIGAVALHLMNLLPNKIDPLHQISRVFNVIKSDS